VHAIGLNNSFPSQLTFDSFEDVKTFLVNLR
jgi:hypothetical protein